MSEHVPHFSPYRNQRTTGAGLDAISAGDYGTSRQTMIARLLLLLVLTWHSFAWTGDPALGPQDGQWLLHGVELGIHETG
ncbi:MAG: hypothetical protein ABIT38_14660, partial [Gemmatimonadaceae bacterium]